MARKTPKKFNKLCQRCCKKCKQADTVLIVSCPRFEASPVQLTIPLKFPPGRPRKARN